MLTDTFLDFCSFIQLIFFKDFVLQLNSLLFRLSHINVLYYFFPPLFFSPSFFFIPASFSHSVVFLEEQPLLFQALSFLFSFLSLPVKKLCYLYYSYHCRLRNCWNRQLPLPFLSCCLNFPYLSLAVMEWENPNQIWEGVMRRRWILFSTAVTIHYCRWVKKLQKNPLLLA